MVSLLEDTKPAKPRLMYRDRVWVCRSFIWLGGMVGMRLGYGYTPQEAYADWKRG